jgi:hypothetical protein
MSEYPMDVSGEADIQAELHFAITDCCGRNEAQFDAQGLPHCYVFNFIGRQLERSLGGPQLPFLIGLILAVLTQVTPTCFSQLLQRRLSNTVKNAMAVLILILTSDQSQLLVHCCQLHKMSERY